MTAKSEISHQEATLRKQNDLENKMATLGWGVGFVWVGVAILSGLSTGIGLLGVGLITLGTQAMRRFSGLAFESLWVVIGILFTLGGLWKIYQVKVELLSTVLLAAGFLLLIRLLFTLMRPDED